MRVLFVSNTSRLGGGEKILLDIIDHLDRDKISPIVISPDEGRLIEELRERAIKYVIVKNGAVYSKLWPFPLIWKVVKLAYWIIRKRVSLVHINGLTVYRDISLAARLTNRKIICHLHFPVSREDLRYAFVIQPDLIICCCKDIDNSIRDYKDLLPKTNIVALPNCIMINSNTMAAQVEVRKKFRLDSRQFVLTIVGDLSKRKGQQYFIEMAKGVLTKFPESKFFIVGEELSSDKGYMQKLVDYAKQLNISDAIFFTGFTDNVADYLKASDIMVLPSLKEGLPLVILEAMAYGKPVIATNVNGISEAVVDGETGFLVTPGSGDELTKAALRLLSDESLRYEMGKRARKRAEDLFDIRKYAQDLESIYLNTLRN